MTVLSRLITAPAGERREMTIPWADWSRGESPTQTVTVKTVLGVAAAWSCIMLLADLVSGLPVHQYRKRTGMVREQIEPEATVVRAPSMIYTRREWLYQAVVSAASGGNAVARVTSREPALSELGGRIASCEWVNPADVTVEQDGPISRPTYRIAGAAVPADDVVHLRRHPQPGSAVGLSPLDLHSDLFDIARATRKYAAQWFRDGAHPTGVLSTDDLLDDDEVKAAKDRFLHSIRGKREPVVLGGTWKYDPVQASPDDSTLVDMWNSIGAQVAQVFRVPAEAIGVSAGTSMTYANRDQRSADLKAFTLEPWTGMFEDWWFGQLPRPQFTKFNFDAFLRSDPSTRATVQDRWVRMGARSINEVRALEDLPPIDGGDEYLWPPYASSIQSIREETP